mmetsp:Transcript_30119/g.76076  ORF Transcript_30119/g.76076 Transcript_30119/m.76076 type:complete len:204 (-) Transcript_30119:439-1050(-)
MGKDSAHVILGELPGLSAMAQCKAPFTNHHWILLQVPSVFLHSTKVLSKSQAMPLVLEAMVPMNFETNVCMPPTCMLLPRLCETAQTSLEDREYHRNAIGFHAGLPYFGHSAIIEAAEHLLWHLWGGLVAHRDAGDDPAIAVPRCDRPQHTERSIEEPMAPMPIRRWTLTTTTRRLSALTAWACMQIEQHLQAALLRPRHRAV